MATIPTAVPVEPDRAAPAPRRGLRGGVVVVCCVVVCALGLAATILQSSFLLTNDGPEHLFSAFVHNHLDDPPYAFRDYVEPNVPATAHGFVQLFSLVEPWLGWRAAYAATLVAIAEVWGIAFFVLVVAVDRRRWPLGLLGFALALQWAFWIGLVTFLLSSAFATAALAAGLHGVRSKNDDERSKNEDEPVGGPVRRTGLLGVAVLLLLAALCHPLPAALGGAVLLTVALVVEPRRRLRRLVAVALAGTPAALVAFTARDTLSGASEWAPLVDRLLLPFDHFASGPVWRGVVVVVVAVTGVVLGARGRPAERALAACAAVLLVVAVVAPTTASGWEFFSPRFLPFALTLPLALLPLERLGRHARAASSVAIAAFVVGSFVWAARFHRALDGLTQPALAVVDDVKPRPAFRQPLILRKLDAPLPVPDMAPLLHLGRVYAVVAGGTVPYGQDSLPHIHHALRRADLPPPLDPGYLPGLQRTPPHDDDARWRFKLTHLAQWARRTGGDVIVFGTPDDLATFVDAGYVAEARAERIMLARFVGCAASIVVDGITGPGKLEVSRDDGEVDVRIAFDETGGALQTFVPDRLLCGPVHVRASPACVEGDETGIASRLGPGAATNIVCTLRPAVNP